MRRSRQSQGMAGECPECAQRTRQRPSSVQTTLIPFTSGEIEAGSLIFPEPQRGTKLEQTPHVYSKGRAFVGPAPKAVRQVGGATEAAVPAHISQPWPPEAMPISNNLRALLTPPDRNLGTEMAFGSLIGSGVGLGTEEHPLGLAKNRIGQPAAGRTGN